MVEQEAAVEIGLALGLISPKTLTSSGKFSRKCCLLRSDAWRRPSRNHTGVNDQAESNQEAILDKCASQRALARRWRKFFPVPPNWAGGDLGSVKRCLLVLVDTV